MEFQTTGEITVCGERLEAGDLRLMYTFDSDQGAKHYDAHSDQQVGSSGFEKKFQSHSPGREQIRHLIIQYRKTAFVFLRVKVCAS